MDDRQNRALTRPPPARDAKGRLLPGHTANPGGRPRMDEIRGILAAHAPAAARKLVALMDSADEGIALRACEALLDRTLGKPAVAVTGADGGALRHEHTGFTPAVLGIIDEIRASLEGDGEASGAKDIAAIRREQLPPRP